jgi:hypothetical protein
MKSLRPLTLITLALMAAMAAYTAPLSPGVPAIQLTFSRAAFMHVLDLWQARGVAIFVQHFAIDYPFLACYGWLGWRVATETGLYAAWPAGLRRSVAWLLPLAAGLDAIENSFHLVFLAVAPQADGWYLLAGLAASAKWGLVALALVGAGWARVSRR